MIACSAIAGQYKYFWGIVDNTQKDLSLSATTFSGDITVVMSTRTRYPTLTNKMWDSGHAPIDRADVIFVARDNKNFTVGNYYVGLSLSTQASRVRFSCGPLCFVAQASTGGRRRRSRFRSRRTRCTCGRVCRKEAR